MITPDVRDIIQRSVLCWLATIDAAGSPSVSPKEVFDALGADHLVIADIASPASVRNIRTHPRVCASVLDVFAQRGYKLKGSARILSPTDPEFVWLAEPLLEQTRGLFPIRHVIDLAIDRVEAILAPSYHLIPGTTESSQIRAAMATYGVVPAPGRETRPPTT